MIENNTWRTDQLQCFVIYWFCVTNVPSLLSNYILIVDIWENLDQSFSLFNKVLTPNASESFLLDMGPLHVAEFL